MSVSWLCYCSILLQDVNIEGNKVNCTWDLFSLFLTNACDLHLFLNKRFNLVRNKLLEMPGKIEYKSFFKRPNNKTEWRVIPCSWIERLNNVKTSVPPNLVYRFSAIPIRILASYFVRYWQTDFKMYVERQTQNSQQNVEGEGQCWRIDTIWCLDLL